MYRAPGTSDGITASCRVASPADETASPVVSSPTRQRTRPSVGESVYQATVTPASACWRYGPRVIVPTGWPLPASPPGAETTGPVGGTAEEAPQPPPARDARRAAASPQRRAGDARSTVVLPLRPHVVLAGGDDAAHAAHGGLELRVRVRLVDVGERRRPDLLIGDVELGGEPAGVDELVGRA